MADIRNCARCGRLFSSTGNRICPACLAEDEKRFQKVAAYLKEHPLADVLEVSQGTGVEEHVILEFVRTGRLEAVGLGEKLQVQCERCGRPIRSGRYCAACQKELAEALAPNTAAQPKSLEDADMYITEFKLRKQSRKE